MKTGIATALIALVMPVCVFATTLRLSTDIDLLVLDGKKVSSSLLRGADSCSAANFFAPKRIKLCTAASVRNTAIAHCANLNASQLQDASDLGIATDEEIKQLTDWKKISGAADAC